jgi:hypothetical protein
MTMTRNASAAATPSAAPVSAARSRTRVSSAAMSLIWLACARSASSFRSSVALTSIQASG